MCTVTYIPLGKNDFILTSNRDESPLRKTISPKTYIEDGVALTYPKDQVAGGTWIGLSEKKRLVCLLNGGFDKHQRAKSYKMSRGVIVKHLLKVANVVKEIEEFDFSDIEPFTLIVLDWLDELKAHELVWTGAVKHFTVLKNEPKIWSSATLYDDEMKKLRERWFKEWLNETEGINSDSVLRFHQDSTKGAPEVSLKMKRSFVETVSVTSVQKHKENVSTYYMNMLENKMITTS